MQDTDPIHLARPSFDEAEIDAVRAVFASGWVAGQGPANVRLETAFRELTATRNAVAVANCTAALHLAMLVLEVRPGDEVIVADYTYPATGHAVMYVAGTPVFADVDPGTGLVDPADVESAITEHTVGIVGVDVAGQCADWDPLRQIADHHGLFLVEDAACAAGATYRGRPAGSLADIACFSLHAKKGITSGEGGLLVTDDDRLAERVRSLSAFGTESAWKRQDETDLPIPTFAALGYNYKLSDIQAAIAMAQVGKLGAFLEKRRKVAEWYASRLRDLPGIHLPLEKPDREHTWQTYAITIDPPYDRNRIAASLRRDGIGSNIGTFASHLQPVYGAARACPRSATLFARQLALPMHVALEPRDVDRVTARLEKALTASSQRVHAG